MLKTIHSLLQLKEADDEGITSGVSKSIEAFKRGYNDAAKRYDDAVKKKQDAQKEAEKATEKAKKEAEKEAAAAHKLKTAEQIAELDDDIQQYISDLFDNFPYQGGAGNAEDLMDKYQTREAAKAAFDAFRAIADRVEQLLNDMNASLVNSDKLSREQIEQIKKRAAKIVNSGKIPDDFIQFAKAEKDFFKSLLRIKNDFRLDDDGFKTVLTRKMNLTADGKKADAVEALNVILTYVVDEFRGQAKYIAAVGMKMDDEARAVRKNARTTT